MPRPKKRRIQNHFPNCLFFKPAGTPKSELEIVELKMDEYDALKFADLDDLNMKVAAEKMWISASTFYRILKSAHMKISDAIINGKAIKICATKI